MRLQFLVSGLAWTIVRSLAAYNASPLKALSFTWLDHDLIHRIEACESSLSSFIHTERVVYGGPDPTLVVVYQPTMRGT